VAASVAAANGGLKVRCLKHNWGGLSDSEKLARTY
jgi:hypothetical protein